MEKVMGKKCGPEVISIDGVDYVKKGKEQVERGPESIIRCRDAGVHVGEVISVERRTVKLHNARRIWRWSGANTLNEVANNGVDRTYSRISEEVPAIILLDACEVIPVADGVDLSEVWSG